VPLPFRAKDAVIFKRPLWQTAQMHSILCKHDLLDMSLAFCTLQTAIASLGSENTNAVVSDTFRVCIHVAVGGHPVLSQLFGKHLVSMRSLGNAKAVSDALMHQTKGLWQAFASLQPNEKYVKEAFAQWIRGMKGNLSTKLSDHPAWKAYLYLISPTLALTDESVGNSFETARNTEKKEIAPI
jgi:hypothetical protein